MLASDVYRRIRVALGGALLSEVSPQDIANEAGRFLFGMHGWNFLAGAIAPANVVAGQDYISLPSDFQSLEDIRSVGDWYNRIVVTTGRELNEAAIYDSNPYHYAAVVTYEPVDVDDPADKRGAIPVLRISPTPNAALVDTLQLVYTRTWKELSDDGDAVLMPAWLEPLYMDVASEYARGVLDQESGTMGERLVRIYQGALFRSARDIDSGMAPNKGVLRNGVGWSDAHRLTDQDLFSEVTFI